MKYIPKVLDTIVKVGLHCQSIKKKKTTNSNFKDIMMPIIGQDD